MADARAPSRPRSSTTSVLSLTIVNCRLPVSPCNYRPSVSAGHEEGERRITQSWTERERRPPCPPPGPGRPDATGPGAPGRALDHPEPEQQLSGGAGPGDGGNKQVRGPGHLG